MTEINRQQYFEEHIAPIFETSPEQVARIQARILDRLPDDYPQKRAEELAEEMAKRMADEINQYQLKRMRVEVLGEQE